MKTDLQISQEVKLLPIQEIAKKANIDSSFLVPNGEDKAKVKLSINQSLKNKSDGKLILVTAINPTPSGIGKSTTTISLVDAFAKLNKNVMGALREPSQGPVFGLKGGATGGGYAQVVPMEEINLHFTGDMHAITQANNLISAVLDNSIYQGNPLNIDIERIVWNRCLDSNDRSLREITIGQGSKFNGVTRKDHFMITVATEVMAVLCLSENLKDFEEKIGKCIVAYNKQGQPVTVKDLGVVGAVSVIMKHAIEPNLVQTLEHTPVLIHGGPFANIAHGCNSIIATKMALKLADYVVTEAGFGSDLGAEKFFNIKCRKANLKPNAVVVVATIGTLKMHGGVALENLKEENVQAMLEGCQNLAKHIDSIQQYHLPYIVTINQFSSDTKNEIEALMEWCKQHHHPVSLCSGWANGSTGAIDLANQLITMVETENDFTLLYRDEDSLKSKIEKISQKIYGAKTVEYSEIAQEKLQQIEKMGYGHFPVCMAKTPASLTDDPKQKNCPKDFTIHVKDVDVKTGAEFVVVYTGSIMTMPGLPKQPAALSMGIDEEGNSYGIF